MQEKKNWLQVCFFNLFCSDWVIAQKKRTAYTILVFSFIASVRCSASLLHYAMEKD